MTGLIIYFAESTIVLSSFYALYAIALRTETFFQFNRIYLLVIPILAMVIPLLRVELRLGTDAVAVPVEQIAQFRTSFHDILEGWQQDSSHQTTASKSELSTLSPLNTFEVIVLAVYGTGVLIVLIRIMLTLRWINKQITTNPLQQRGTYKIVMMATPTAPFSFMNYVFIHRSLIESPDFNQVLAHELVHIKQKHSIDIIFIQLAAGLMWFNPMIWLLVKSLKATHEYIADKNIIQSGYSVSEYQSVLLRQLISNNSNKLVHNFNFSFIKKRIAMMTNKQSGRAGKLKLGAITLLIPICSAFIMHCNSRIEEQVRPEVPSEQSGLNAEIPVLPPSGYTFEGDLKNATTFTIVDDKLFINGKTSAIDSIASLAGEEGRTHPVQMVVDRNQRMETVRAVETALRKADRRKLLYIGQTSTGQRVEVPIVLPPHPSDKKYAAQPELSAVPSEHIIIINVSEDARERNQERVYDFVTEHIKNEKADLCVVGVKYKDDDRYVQYLPNLFYVKEGYISIYQERAREMFKKDFYETTNEEYTKVREGIPTNISISEM